MFSENHNRVFISWQDMALKNHGLTIIFNSFCKIYHQSSYYPIIQCRLPGQAVLLCSTAQCIHLHALDVGSCLDGVWVWNQVGQTSEKTIKKRLFFFFTP